MKRVSGKWMLGISTIVIMMLQSSGAKAQGALWNLSLSNPIQTVNSGTSGTVVYNGEISNLDASNTLNLMGDSFSTVKWDSSLSITEDPAFTNFLNNTGFLSPGTNYTGAIFDVGYTNLTPPTQLNSPYTGSVDITTDGIPTDLTSNFSLAVLGSPAVPETRSGLALFTLLMISMSPSMFNKNRAQKYL